MRADGVGRLRAASGMRYDDAREAEALGTPGQAEVRWANMSTSAVAAASLVAVPGGHGGLSGKQRGLADAGGTYASADGWKSRDKIKLDMFTGHKLQVDTMSNAGPYARMQGL
jgi:hypothetical protein